MTFEGDGGGFRTHPGCQSSAFSQQYLMAQMNPVKKTQGKDKFGTAHVITSFFQTPTCSAAYCQNAEC
jgi:hypothetical protein